MIAKGIIKTLSSNYQREFSNTASCVCWYKCVWFLSVYLHPDNLFFLIYYYYYFLLYNIVLVLPYINMHPPWVYTYSPSWTPLLSPSPYPDNLNLHTIFNKYELSCFFPVKFILTFHCILQKILWIKMVKYLWYPSTLKTF